MQSPAPPTAALDRTGASAWARIHSLVTRPRPAAARCASSWPAIASISAARRGRCSEASSLARPPRLLRPRRPPPPRLSQGSARSRLLLLAEAQQRVGPVGLGQGREVAVVEAERQGRHRVFEVLEPGSADDGGGDGRLMQQPGEGDLGGTDAEAAGHRDDPLHDVEVRILVVQPLGVVVAVRAAGLAQALAAAAIAGQEAAGEGTPWDDPESLLAAERQHLPLLLAIDQVVVVLHGDEAGPTMPVGEIERLGELPGVHARGAEVAGLACPHHVMERFQRLLDRRRGVPAMDLVEVDVVGAEAAQRAVDGVEDVFARQPAVIRTLAHRKEDLGGDDHLVALGEVAERPPQHLLAGAARVHVGGVEEVHAHLERPADERPALLFRQHPVAPLAAAIAHATEAETGDLESGTTQVDVVHGPSVYPRLSSAAPRAASNSTWVRAEGEPTAARNSIFSFFSSSCARRLSGS